jgi:hypothetical protein
MYKVLFTYICMQVCHIATRAGSLMILDFTAISLVLFTCFLKENDMSDESQVKNDKIHWKLNEKEDKTPVPCSLDFSTLQSVHSTHHQTCMKLEKMSEPHLQAHH